MFLSDLSIKRPIMISMMLIALLLFGIIGYFRLNLDLMPDVSFPVITIRTIYPGGGPKEIEMQVTKRIEDAVSSISNIEEMTSYSMEAISFVFIRFGLDKNVDVANQEVKEKIDAIVNNLPDDADRPIIQKMDINERPIIDIVFTGNLEMTELYTFADQKLRDRFAQIEGVAHLSIIGGGEREIQVELDNRTVYQHKVSLAQLAGILKMQNMDMPGGHFEQQTQDYSVRLKGEFNAVKTLADLKVPTGSGIKRLGDIADIKDTSEEIRIRSSYFDNERKIGSDNVVLLSLVKAKDGNTVTVAHAVKKLVQELEQELPAGTHLGIITDSSTLIEGAVRDTLGNILLGILLTGLVLLFFLHDIRSTIIVSLSMPLSILSAFFLMQISGFTLNIMTLMGLSTAVGILVVNSVVVLENIFRFKEMGHNRHEAASRGTAEVVLAVLAATMTNLVVFLPVANMSSMIGKFFEHFALTVVYATLFSLLMSFTLTPMMASLILPEQDTKRRPIGQRMESIFHGWESVYRRMLGWVLKSKLRSVLIIFISLVIFISSFQIASRLGFDFVPALDEGDIQIEVELPTGYNLEQTADLMKEVEKRTLVHSQVKTITTTLGQFNERNFGANLARLKIKLVDVWDRDISTDEAVSLLIQDYSDIPNALIRVSPLSSIADRSAAIDLVLKGQDVDVLETFKDRILAKIENIDGMMNLTTSSRPGKPEISIFPDREKLANAGLTIYDLAITLRSALEGMVTTKYKEQGEEYDIRVSLNDETVNSPEEIANIAIVGKSGTFRFSQLCDIEFSEGYSQIVHKDKYKIIQFSAGIAPGVVMSDITNEIDRRLEDIEFPSGYQIEWIGASEMMKETVRDMFFTFILAVILTYMLLAAILESLTQPLLILGTVPLAFVGVFSGLYLFGIPFNSPSMMGIIMLLGIVVNNAILQFDYANTLIRQHNYSVRNALLEACPIKLKPILMSSTAIILGMLPMALGMGASGKEWRQPMGVVSIGGLAVSMVLSLFVIPTLYYLTIREKQSDTSVPKNSSTSHNGED